MVHLPHLLSSPPLFASLSLFGTTRHDRIWNDAGLVYQNTLVDNGNAKTTTWWNGCCRMRTGKRQLRTSQMLAYAPKRFNRAGRAAHGDHMRGDDHRLPRLRLSPSLARIYRGVPLPWLRTCIASKTLPAGWRLTETAVLMKGVRESGKICVARAKLVTRPKTDRDWKWRGGRIICVSKCTATQRRDGRGGSVSGADRGGDVWRSGHLCKTRAVLA
ncbi:hypothetical protein FIBSPDRAFT_263275 [Athelia psychrophila]|uniref:Uncharacterized protein n=1 Tax=Athelia psychrophila TaxID=1759441 RepID=A0A165XBA1_9AGAM|nr:hypothetical protein FIBSPDRAFT_263275 [Fibularhizoctonia sp. CBS 109695]